MENIISDLENVPLSNIEVLKLLEGKANVILYPDLYKYRSLKKVLLPYGSAFILYESQPNYGHWCAFFQSGPNEVEFFDPYGSKIDSQLEYINDDFAKQSHQDKPYLTNLIKKAKFKVTSNNHDFQQLKENIKTCGRWSALRLHLKEIPLDIFIKTFGKKNGDELVTILTMHVNKLIDRK